MESEIRMAILYNLLKVSFLQDSLFIPGPVYTYFTVFKDFLVQNQDNVSEWKPIDYFYSEQETCHHVGLVGIIS